MKTLIKAEEVAQFALSIVLFAKLSFVYWVYPALFLVPDLSMSGYAINARVGAFVYNLAHHKGMAIGIGLISLFLGNNWWLFAGIILFGHSALDRAFD